MPQDNHTLGAHLDSLEADAHELFQSRMPVIIKLMGEDGTAPNAAAIINSIFAHVLMNFWMSVAKTQGIENPSQAPLLILLARDFSNILLQMQSTLEPAAPVQAPTNKVLVEAVHEVLRDLVRTGAFNDLKGPSASDVAQG